MGCAECVGEGVGNRGGGRGGCHCQRWSSELSKKYVDTTVTQDVVRTRMTYTANMKPNT